MTKAVIFGGTTEGRKLCESCAEYEVSIVYCVATEDGARSVENLPNIKVRVGRLNTDGMTALLKEHEPSLVIDATHPYAEEAGRNIKAACGQTSVKLIRVHRESVQEAGCSNFRDMDELLAWLETEQGNIFVSTGASSAEAFIQLPDYQSRVWMRVLPSLDSLETCLRLGYRPERLICMQGPFSEELNYAMFRNSNARVLVTKESGAPGGFSEKVRAAQSLGMVTAVLSKPNETGGVSLEEAYKIIMELGL